MKPMNYTIEMSTDPEFINTVDNIIKKYDIKSIIETGAFHGLGSTTVFAKTGLPVFSIECNPNNVQTARENLKSYPNVTIIASYSLKVEDMKRFIVEDDIYSRDDFDIEYDGNVDPKGFYLNEIGNNDLPENLLKQVADTPDRQLILLDSAGGVGWLEFMEFMSFDNIKNKVLLLDDVSHVKHFRSVNFLKQSGKEFNYSSSQRWGWCNFVE